MTAALMEWLASASALIVVVLLLRRLLGERISAGLRYGLWAVVLIRLLVPVSFSLLSIAVPQLPKWDPPEVMQEESIYVLPIGSTPVEEADAVMWEDGTIMEVNSFGYSRLEDGGEKVVRYANKISPLELLKWVWIAGAAVMGTVLVVTNLRFSRRLRRVRRPLEGTNAPVPVYVAPALPSPCLVGLFFPAVYVTEEAVADPAMLRHVLAHELTHYNHRDHLWSVLRGVALAVHWWNPLVWLAVVCSRRDGELACDEGALKQLGDSERTAYGETLLSLVTAKARPADLLSFTTTMSGGKRSLRERIQRIAHQPKQLASAVAAVVIVLSVSVLVAFGQARWIDPDSVTGFTAFKASSYTITPENTIVYTPADLQKDLQTPKNAVRVSREDGMKLIYLINAHGKSVYGQGDLTLNGQEHYFVKIDCTDGGFYLLDYWYWNGFSFNPLHFGEDDFTTLITHFDADGNAGTTWQMDYSFDLIYSPGWSSAAVRKSPDTAASGSDVTDADAWRSPDIVLTVDGVIELGYDIPGGGVEIVRSNPVPAPRAWATLDPLTLDSRTRATALEGLPTIWAELVNPLDGWLVACYGRGVTVAGTYVYKTEDGGMNWTEVAMPGTNWQIADAAFLSPDRMIVAQQLFDSAPCMITKDRGETWEEIELPDVQVLDISYSRCLLTMWIGQHEGDPPTFSMTSTDLGDHWKTLSSEESYAEDHPDDVWSTLADLLENLTPEDIGDISGQDKVNAEELVNLLLEVSAHRGSRYHTYSTFEEEEAWTWSMGEWAVPLSNGGTLHLLACDSGNLEISYESEKEAVSAFYSRQSTLYNLILEVGTHYSKVLPYSVDLDRDGILDELSVNSESDTVAAWSLRCALSSGGSWETKADTSHAGWNAVFLCQMDGEDYLLQYVPYFGQMHGEYHYKLFYLDQNRGREVVVQENSLDFQINPTGHGNGADPVFGDTDLKEIAAFMDEINSLLANSTQLLNTDRYLQSVFANEGRLYDSMYYMQETWEPDKTLLENLLIYRNQILADMAVGEVTDLHHIAEEDIISAVLEDGTPVSKSAIADILHSDKAIRFNYHLKEAEWEPKYLVIKVTYTSPGDTGEQTLTMQAGVRDGSNYVRIIMEGQKTALQYSENPDNDATYLRDVPYSIEGFMYSNDIYDRYTSDLYDRVVKLSKEIEQS